MSAMQRSILRSSALQALTPPVRATPVTLPIQTALSPAASPSQKASLSTSQLRQEKVSDLKHMNGSGIDDAIEEREAAGRTGGGEPLSSSQNPPAQPKIHNTAVPPEKEQLSEEQVGEIRQHNEDFEHKHDRAAPAADDKVDKNFFSSDVGKSVKN